MLRNRLFPALIGVGLLTGCHLSKVEESPPDPLASPSVEGEWQLFSIEAQPDFRADPNTNTALRLSLAATVRPLGQGRVQLPRWIFRPDGKVLIRWPAVGTLPRRTRMGGTHRKLIFSHQTVVKTRSGAPEQEVSFAGDTLLLFDAKNHLITRLLPVY